MTVKIEKGWSEALAPEFDKDYFKALTARVRAAYAASPGGVFPPGRDIFAAFDSTPFADVKVVIIGQDPYHGSGQANGMAFSVARECDIPPSLRNIFSEIHTDTGAPIPGDGDLSRWASQGVLLLNATLTVLAGRPRSMSGIGWETFTDAAVDALNRSRDNLVFMLWGADARRKGAAIDRNRHLVLEAPHPSPLSAHRGFFGCRHFSRANQYLISKGKTPIIW